MNEMSTEQTAVIAAESGALSDRLTILHVGDVFLDGPVRRLRRDTKERRREELRAAFERFMQRVDEERAHLVVFSGNLIDGKYAGEDTLSFLLNAFANRPQCHFVIAPGAHDPYTDESIYRSKRLPRNVHIFGEEVLGGYSFPELPLKLYGWGWRAEATSCAPLSGAHQTRGDSFVVLCGHAREDNGALAPNADAIAAFGAHYTALSGAPHDGFHRAGDGIYSYSGGFEGRETGELGEMTGGYIRISAEREDGGWSMKVARVPLDTYSYVTARLDVSHLSSADGARPRLEALVSEGGYGEKTILHVILCGSVPISADFSGLEGETYGVYSLWVDDRTVPTDTDGRLLQEMNARGELYRHFYPKMMEGSEEECARAARAFRIGYAALRGEDFAKF